MIKRGLTYFLAAVFALAAVLPVAAAEPDLKTMAKTAHVLSLNGRDNNITVYFEPFKVPGTGANAQRLQTIPAEVPVEILTSAGKVPHFHGPLPGQEVKITFTYRLRDGTFEIVGYQKIEMIGKSLIVGDGKYTNARPNTLVGTVIAVTSSRFSMYVESGLVYKDGFEYFAYGPKTLSFDTDTSVFSSDDRRLQGTDIKPFQRVEVKLATTAWSEAIPPVFSGGKCRTVNILGYDDKWGSDNYGNTREFTCVVTGQLKNANGETELLVKPSSVYELYNQPKAVIRNSVHSDINLASYTAGTFLTITYIAVNEKIDPPVYQYITAIEANKDYKQTAQELSGVFGKPGDVTLAVKPNVVSPTADNIKVVCTNKTGTALWFTNWFVIEVKKDGKWSMFSDPSYKESIGLIPEGPTAEPRADTEFTYWVRLYTNRLPAGTYRLVGAFSPRDADGMPAADYLITSSEFTVK